jgi:transposase InsO family protein
MLWRWKSRQRGRPCLPKNIRELIVEMDRDNPAWGEERIANELSLKLGIRVSPRTVRKYLTRSPRRGKSTSQHWSTFVRNHAKAIVACDFLTVVTARFRVFYVFVAMEVGSRRIVHVNVTDHPTTEWTIQQLREFLPFDHSYRFLIHDRDAKFAPDFDPALRTFGVRGLRTPVRTPTANSYCERLIGTLRRDCLDFVIPLNEPHLRSVLKEYINHFNRGRPHSSLGPGIPEPPQAKVPAWPHRHKLPPNCRVKSLPVLGGLHHEYGLEKEAA